MHLHLLSEGRRRLRRPFPAHAAPAQRQAAPRNVSRSAPRRWHCRRQSGRRSGQNESNSWIFNWCRKLVFSDDDDTGRSEQVRLKNRTILVTKFEISTIDSSASIEFRPCVGPTIKRIPRHHCVDDVAGTSTQSTCRLTLPNSCIGTWRT